MCIYRRFKVKRKNSRGGVSAAVVGTGEMSLEGLPHWETGFHVGDFSGVC